MVLGHDLIRRFSKERFQLFLTGLMAMYSGAGVLLPLGVYKWVLRSPWFLAIAAVCAAQCVVLGAALHLARRSRHQQAITLVCIGNWAAVLLVTFVAPNLLPVMVLAALVPVVFAEFLPDVRWQRGLAFAVITAGCALALGAVGRFQNVSHLDTHTPRAIQSAFLIAALPVLALHILVIAWNNAAALRTSEKLLAERGAQLAASRTRLISAADEERRRLERDLHDDAQQHLVGAHPTRPHRRTRPISAAAHRGVRAAGDRDRRDPQTRPRYLPPAAGQRRSGPSLASGRRSRPGPRAAEPAGPGPLPGFDRGRPVFLLQRSVAECRQTRRPGTTVTITAHADDRMLTLTISDTGRGFDPATVGTGLTNMTDRLSAGASTFTVQTARTREFAHEAHGHWRSDRWRPD